MSQPRVGNQNSITPDPGVAVLLTDKAGVAFSASPLPASSAWLFSEVFSVSRARFLALQAFYAAHASTTAGQARLQVRVSNEDTAPAFDAAAVWSELPLPDDALQTAAGLTGTLGTWETAGPFRNIARIRGHVAMLPAAVANSDKIDWAAVYDVTAWRWCQIRVQETGDTTNRGTVTLKASLTA